MMEVCLMRLAYNSPRERRQILASAQPYQPRIRKVGDRTITLEISESPEIVDDFVTVMSAHTIFDMSRSGMTALGPGIPPKRRDSHTEVTSVEQKTG
jgi:acetolactate synthase small subunit